MGARLAIAKRLAACLSLLSPDMACKYLAGHARLSTLYGYDAAKRTGPNARWLPRDGKADSLISRDGRIIRARSRAMVRDNPNMGGAIRRMVSNVVFTGIKPQAQLRSKDNKPDSAANNRVEDVWNVWPRLSICGS